MALYHPPNNLLSDVLLHSFLDPVAGVRKLTRALLLGFLVCRLTFLALIKRDDVNRNHAVGFPGADCNLYWWLIDKSAKSLF